jgi:hypothetical protein
MEPKRMSTSGIVQLVIRRAVAGHQADSQYFTTWDVLSKAGWRADVASGMLQMKPGKHYGLLPFAQEFNTLMEIEVATTMTLANKQYGPGGGVKLYIPFRDHQEGLEPVGELIPVGGYSELCDPEPAGVIKDLLDLEISLGNTLLGADRVLGEEAKRRFWMQDPLHLPEIDRELNLPQSIQPFEDPDMHCNVAGFVDMENMQFVGAPPQKPE